MVIIREYGQFGNGEHPASIKGVHTQTYRVWNDMIHRCSNLEVADKYVDYLPINVYEALYNYEVEITD